MSSSIAYGYEFLLRQLHSMMKDGKEGTPEIRALREQMDEAGEQLTEEEVGHMHELSAGLYRGIE